MNQRIIIILCLLLGIPFSLQAQCDGARFKEKIFDQIIQVNNILYGSNYNNLGEKEDLYMDISMPDPNMDTLHERPLIIMMHGGAFVAGDKDVSTMLFMRDEYARRGYVIASIQYRLEKSNFIDSLPILEFASKANWYQAIIRAVQDVKGAIRYLKYTYAEEQNPFGIDTSNITLYGSSAGAISIIHAVYLDPTDSISGTWNSSIIKLGGLEGTTSSHNQYGSVNTVKNLIVDSGALGKAFWIQQKNDVAVLALHHNADPSVPYGHGCFYVAACHLGKFDGPQIYVPWLENIHNRVEKYVVWGAAHPVDDLDPQFALEKGVAFLYQSQCDYYGEDTTVSTGIFAKKKTTQFQIYPNPNSGSFRIANAQLQRGDLIQISTILGQVIYSEPINNENQTIRIDIPPGVYQVSIYNQSGIKGISRLVVQQ